MTSSTNHEAGSTAQAAIILFASISNYMSEIETILRSKHKPTIRTVMRSCDVWKFPGAEWALPDRFAFSAKVEAETETGEVFYWSFEILLESEKWTLSRNIDRQEKYGPGSIREFESVTYESFSALQNGYAPLMSEFVRSTEGFAFPSSLE